VSYFSFSFITFFLDFFVPVARFAALVNEKGGQANNAIFHAIIERLNNYFFIL